MTEKFLPNGKQILSFSPKKVLTEINQRGKVTVRDVEQICECSSFGASWVSNYLQREKFINASGWTVSEEDNHILTNYEITEEGRKEKPEGEIVVTFQTMPAFSSHLEKVANTLLETAEIQGISIEELAQKVDSSPREVGSLIQKISRKILYESNSEEIRNLGKEIKGIFENKE